MRSIDFDAHNGEVRRVWEAYRSGRPIRPPMILGINVRYTMWRSDANHTGIGFERYFTDPDAMLLRQLEHKAWVRRHVPQDSEMGLPTAGWDVQVDFQNSYEAGWFGCPVRFFDGEVPDTEPAADRRSRQAKPHRARSARPLRGRPHGTQLGVLRAFPAAP